MNQTLNNSFTVAPAGLRVLALPPGQRPAQADAYSTRLARYLATAATKNLAILTISSNSVARPLFCSSTHAPGPIHLYDCSHHC